MKRWFPETCASCELDTTAGALCPGCRGDWIAARAIDPVEPLVWVRAPYRYALGLADLVPRMKFQRERVLARALGRALAEAVLPPLGDWLLVPIPLHRSRLIERRFNQAHEIAMPLAGNWDLPLVGALAKTKATPAQSTLGAGQRRENLRGAFRAVADVSGRSIVLVDDVMTTGSTLSIAARTLLRAGARRVAAVVVART